MPEKLHKYPNKKNIPILLICVAVFLVSATYSFYFQIPPLVDARAYDKIAWNLAQGFGYREDITIPIAEDNSIIRVGPGYEFFLAFLYFVFGHHYAVIWVVQAMLLAGSAYFTYKTSRLVFQERWTESIGLFGASLIGFSPDLITMSAMLMTETLAIFLSVLAVYLFFRFLETNGWHDWVLVSIALACAVLVRTPLAFLGIPMGITFLYRRKIAHLVVMGAIVVLFFTPWIIRNYRVFGVFIPTNAAAGFNLHAGNHIGASGEQEPDEILGAYISQFGYIEANRRATREAKEFIVSHPLEYGKLTLSRISIYFSFARPTGFWFHLHGASRLMTLILSGLYSIILFIFGFFGIWKSGFLPIDIRKKTIILLLILIMMPLAIVGIIIETRYRFLSYPMFALFAGFGFMHFLNNRARWMPLVWVSIFLWANTFFDVASNISRIMERIKKL